MNIKTARIPNNKGNASLVILVVVLLIVILGLGAYIYKLQTNKAIQPPTPIPATVNGKPSEPITVEPISTADWETYPTEGSYTGWSIKHPAESAPIANQKDTRISLFVEDTDTEALMISIENAGKFSEGTRDDHLKVFKNAESCPLVEDIKEITLGTNDAYSFSNSCEDMPNDLGIFGKRVETYIVINPYLENSYIKLKVYTDNEKATPAQKALAQAITETLTVIEPQQTLPEGYKGFSNPTLGYSVIFPEKYKIQTGEMAWPNAQLILYGGGQSYDLVVQVWNSEDEYEQYFENNSAVMENLTVKQVKGKFVTFLNQNKDPEVAKIIESFKVE